MMRRIGFIGVDFGGDGALLGRINTLLALYLIYHNFYYFITCEAPSTELCRSMNPYQTGQK